MYDYDEAVENLAYSMLDKIAEESDYEMERTAGARLDAAKDAVKGYGKRMSFGNTRKAQKYVNFAKKHNWKGGDANEKMYWKKAKQKRRKALGKDLVAHAGTAATIGGGAYGVSRLKNKGQEKAAAMYEEAQLYKQAAEETYQEAQMIQDAASLVFDYFEE